MTLWDYFIRPWMLLNMSGKKERGTPFNSALALVKVRAKGVWEQLATFVNDLLYPHHWGGGGSIKVKLHLPKAKRQSESQKAPAVSLAPSLLCFRWCTWRRREKRRGKREEGEKSFWLKLEKWFTVQKVPFPLFSLIQSPHEIAFHFDLLDCWPFHPLWSQVHFEGRALQRATRMK